MSKVRGQWQSWLQKASPPFEVSATTGTLTIKSVAVFLWSFIVIRMSRSIHIKMRPASRQKLFEAAAYPLLTTH